MKKPSGQFTSIGGQAVIEGVMMRSPHFIAVAVRRSNQRIVIRSFPFFGVAQKFPFLRKPILRGVVTLVESMVQGIDALSYSANIAVDSEEKGEDLSALAITGSILSALVLGMGLFVALPHFLAAMVTSSKAIHLTAQSPVFHLVDGALKITILLIYVYLIALMKDIHRVFQYHGAEHKSIYAFESGVDLTVENAKKFSTLHPRCGTSFLLFLVLISVGVFSAVFPLFQLTSLFAQPFLNHLFMVVVKMVLMLPIAGISYEFIKACSFRMENPLFKVLIWPGLMLQKLTTREPTDDQLEVALASLRQVLRLEKGQEILPDKSANDKVAHDKSAKKMEIEIAQLSELKPVMAQVAEFPEA